MQAVPRRLAISGGLGGLAAAVAGCGNPLAVSSTTPAGPPATTQGPSAAPTPSARQTERPPPPGPLPGVATWTGVDHVSQDLADSGARWYYTFAPHHHGIESPPGCEFVPMIWGRPDLTDAALAQAASLGTSLLAFNEPLVRTQAHMSVQEALTAWPRLQETGLHLGAPAVAAGADRPGGWLDRFMSGVRGRKYRVDFLPLHWYIRPRVETDFSISRAVDDLHDYLKASYDRYNLPIWLTEFSLISWHGAGARSRSSSLQAEFLDASAAMMTTLPYVHRWAWFSLTPKPYAPTVALYDDDGRTRSVGRQFRRIS
ncbi:MAG TPA: glycosyl hydrolase [Flexivirga sp.]|uniref:glycosyl hydrolase n=1 Tax=Flexivirga sp. TaxID=1962927 RepID=UPI002CD7F761|nr:glycosyl hydrolase [Flexivirga sp.]HWC23354.1 glycosyl hydrolase [Flexivirga sp.]